jgi:hypothetical protein
MHTFLRYKQQLCVLRDHCTCFSNAFRYMHVMLMTM